MLRKFPVKFRDQSGFSIVELLIAFGLVTTIGLAASFYLRGQKRLYKPDDQTLLITDILQEARQRSLTQRETMRVEIDLTENHIRLIDENSVTTVDDDKVLRVLPLYYPNEVRMDKRPNNIAYEPPEPLPVPSAVFAPSVYPSSATHQVCTLRFMSNGTVTNGGNNGTGDGAVPVGFTLYVWQPDQSNANNSTMSRALTILGSTGSVRFWEFDPNFPNANKWKDSRRVGNYGAAQN